MQVHPVIVTRHAAIEEMVREGKEALFVSPRAPEDIAKALTQISNYTLWQSLSANARQRYIDYFGAGAVSKKWLT